MQTKTLEGGSKSFLAMHNVIKDGQHKNHKKRKKGRKKDRMKGTDGQRARDTCMGEKTKLTEHKNA